MNQLINNNNINIFDSITKDYMLIFRKRVVVVVIVLKYCSYCRTRTTYDLDVFIARDTRGVFPKRREKKDKKKRYLTTITIHETTKTQ